MFMGQMRHAIIGFFGRGSDKPTDTAGELIPKLVWSEYNQPPLTWIMQYLSWRPSGLVWRGKSLTWRNQYVFWFHSLQWRDRYLLWRGKLITWRSK